MAEGSDSLRSSDPRRRQRRLLSRVPRRRVSVCRSRWSRRTRSAAPACTEAASRRRHCCTRPISSTRSRHAGDFGIIVQEPQVDWGKVLRLQGLGRRPHVQGPLRAGRVARRSSWSRARAASSTRGRSRSRPKTASARSPRRKAIVLAPGAYPRELPVHPGRRRPGPQLEPRARRRKTSRRR